MRRLPVPRIEERSKPSASFSSWKFDIINAADADPALTAVQFRILVRVLNAVNEDTGIAIIGDDLLSDEVPGCRDRKTAQRARKAIARRGWWTYEEGAGRKATRYRISDAPINGILDELDAANERRQAERKNRRAAEWERRKDRTNAERRTGALAPRLPFHRTGAEESHLAIPHGDSSVPRTGAPVPPVHPHSTPSKISLPSEEVSQDVHARELQAPLACKPLGSIRTAQDHLYRLLGDGSFTTGVVIGSKLGDRFYAAAARLAERGLTHSEIAELKAA